MKVFLAGYFAAGRGMPTASSIHRRITSAVTYPCILESFHYMTAAILAAIRHHRQKIFLDSGAFSAFTLGATIDLGGYAEFIRRNADVVEIAASLDVIGDRREVESYQNLKTLEQKLGSGKILPVHHVRDHDDWLRRYLDEGYQHIALGGMVPESTPVLRQWLDHVWHNYLTKPDGSAKVKVHGFGLTSPELMFRYPWHSVDSTTWLTVSHYGGVLLDFPQPDGTVKDFKVEFSSRSAKRYDLGSWHFKSLKPDEQEVVLARLDELEAERAREPGLEAAFRAELGTTMAINNPDALAKSYGMRDLVIFAYYRRAMRRSVDKFVSLQPTLWE